MLKEILVIAITITLLHAASYTVTIASSPNKSPMGTHPYGSGIGVQFTLTPNPADIHSALLYISHSATDPSANFGYYNHNPPTITTNYDLQNANKGTLQKIYIANSGPGSVYFWIINFDVTGSKTYTVTATDRNVDINAINACPALQKMPNTLFCQNCPSSNFGAYCQLTDMAISQSGSYTFTVPPTDYKLHTIGGSKNKIKLTYYSLSLTPSAELFVQFKLFSSDVAGYINNVKSVSGQNFPIYSAGITNSISFSGDQVDISIAVINKDATNPVDINLSYTQEKVTNILAIVLGVLGGLLFIALVIVACFIARRLRNPEQMVHPRASQIVALQQQQLLVNALTSQQIQTFFPSVLCRLIFPEEENSSINLIQQNKNIDRDCVICLCPVGVNDLMKVTYCRHIFHGNCLTEWFKKQRNCPYCRQDYNKSATTGHYQNLLKVSKKNFLAGVDLVQQILRVKQMTSSIMIEDVKDE